MRIINFYMVLVLLVLATGCGQTPGMAGQNQATPSLDPAYTIPPPLTLDMLKNAEYQAQDGMRLVRLVEGKYETGSGTDYVSVSMLDQVAFGDLDSNYAQDAAIILVENYGGSGAFEYLVPVFNNSGAPLPSSGYFLGDRVVVNSLNIGYDNIILDMMVHSPNDPLCCPSQAMTQSFKFYWGPGLVQVQVRSETPAGGLREIVIENPRVSDKVSNPIQLTGTVSISPFENTLMMRVLDASNNIIYQGPIQVSAPDMGAPGSFDTLVDISGSPVNSGDIRIEILDISMADGSILALDSVDVILK